MLATEWTILCLAAGTYWSILGWISFSIRYYRLFLGIETSLLLVIKGIGLLLVLRIGQILLRCLLLFVIELLFGIWCCSGLFCLFFAVVAGRLPLSILSIWLLLGRIICLLVGLTECFCSWRSLHRFLYYFLDNSLCCFSFAFIWS